MTKLYAFLRRLLIDVGIIKVRAQTPVLAQEFPDMKPVTQRARKAWTCGIEFTERQAIELLADWMIVPSAFRNDLVRSFYRFRNGFTVATIRTLMTQRGYNISHNQIIEEMRPFLHRRLVVPVQEKHNVKRYRLSNRRVHNATYARFFVRKKPVRTTKFPGPVSSAIRPVPKK